MAKDRFEKLELIERKRIVDIYEGGKFLCTAHRDSKKRLLKIVKRYNNIEGLEAILKSANNDIKRLTKYSSGLQKLVKKQGKP